MPPAALISSVAIFMPLATETPHVLIGPERSWWVPTAISVSVIPWFVVLTCASAIGALRTNAAPASAAMPSRNLICFSSLRVFPCPPFMLSQPPGTVKEHSANG